MFNHRHEIEQSDLCGCLYCRRTFLPSAITYWIDDDTTAMCPHCGVDYVIGSASGYPITKEFLQAWYDANMAIYMRKPKPQE